MYGYKIVHTENYDLTTDALLISVDESVKFSKYTATTSDGTAFTLASTTDGDYFPISESRGTMPMTIDTENTMGADTNLFYAKVASGTATLSIMFFQR